MELDSGMKLERTYLRQFLGLKKVVSELDEEYDYSYRYDGCFPPNKHEEIWNCLQKQLEDFETIYTGKDHDKVIERWSSNGTVIAKVNMASGDLTIDLYGDQMKHLEDYINEWDEVLQKYKNPDHGKVNLDFTYYSQSRGDVNTNSLTLNVPEWGEIHQNYVGETQDELDDVFDGVDLDKGKLMVWYGETGTGKTFALRAFMRDLKGEYNFYYITDPDVFMHNPDYYYKLSSRAEEKKSFFIFEDCAKYISPESRRSDEAGIAKILNITDGLIGQGKEDLFLFTFNEEKDQIDDAIIRPGRCNKIVKFLQFNQSEAVEWLEENGYNGSAVDGDKFSLADLYSRLEGQSDDDNSYEDFEEEIGF